MKQFTVKLNTDQATRLKQFLGELRVAQLPPATGHMIWYLYKAIGEQLVLGADHVDCSGSDL